MGYKMGGQGSILTRDKEIFLYSSVSEVALRPSQPHIQWIFPRVNAAELGIPSTILSSSPRKKENETKKKHGMGSLTASVV
jgi:hypothetical protein